LRECPELRRAVGGGQVGFQVNPVMTDRTNRKKTLDLGIGLVDDARPHPRRRSLLSLLQEYGGALSDADHHLIDDLPPMYESYSKQDLVVLENKACMTAHGKAAPRLRNELEGAVEAINKSDSLTVAGGLVVVNASSLFVSPVYRDNGYVEPGVRRPTSHSQPDDAKRAVSKLKNIPLRSKDAATGYDALGIIVVSAANDGRPCTLVQDPAFGAPESTDIWHYTRFIQELAKQYRHRVMV
jgi:hypothetical protein